MRGYVSGDERGDVQSLIARYVTEGDVGEDGEVFAFGESEVVRSTVKLHDAQ